MGSVHPTLCDEAAKDGAPENYWLGIEKTNLVEYGGLDYVLRGFEVVAIAYDYGGAD
jgi:hypothetical protein